MNTSPLQTRFHSTFRVCQTITQNSWCLLVGADVFFKILSHPVTLILKHLQFQCCLTVGVYLSSIRDGSQLLAHEVSELGFRASKHFRACCRQRRPVAQANSGCGIFRFGRRLFHKIGGFHRSACANLFMVAK